MNLKRQQAYFAAMPGRILEIADRVGVSYQTAAKQLRDLREANLAHISGWTNTLPREAILAEGKAPDASRPKPKTPAERMANHRERRKCRSL